MCVEVTIKGTREKATLKASLHKSGDHLIMTMNNTKEHEMVGDAFDYDEFMMFVSHLADQKNVYDDRVSHKE